MQVWSEREESNVDRAAPRSAVSLRLCAFDVHFGPLFLLYTAVFGMITELNPGSAA